MNIVKIKGNIRDLLETTKTMMTRQRKKDKYLIFGPRFIGGHFASHLQLGEQTQAIAIIQMAIDARTPEFKEQGEFLIGEIRAGRNP